MTRTLLLVTLASVTMGLAACPRYVDRVFDEKVEEWRVAHPGEEPTSEILAELRYEATAEAERETERLAAGAAGALGQAAAGNWLGAIFGLLGLIGGGAGVYAKLKERKT